jgi:hypothetical protein
MFKLYVLEYMLSFCVYIFQSRGCMTFLWLTQDQFMSHWFHRAVLLVEVYACVTALFQYSGWSANNKEMYYPAPIVFKMQNRKETIVEFLRDAIKEWVCMYLCIVYYHCTVLSVYSCFMKHIGMHRKWNYLKSLCCELDPSLVFVCGSSVHSTSFICTL